MRLYKSCLLCGHGACLSNNVHNILYVPSLGNSLSANDSMIIRSSMSLGGMGVEMGKEVTSEMQISRISNKKEYEFKKVCGN